MATIDLHALSRWRNLFKGLMLIGVPCLLLGWIGASLSSRTLYFGVGPPNTSFRHIALEAAGEMSNRVAGARFVFCPTKGTADALRRLSQPALPLVGKLFRRGCDQLDVAAITDGTQLDESADKVTLLTPLYKSYVQVFARRELNLADLKDLVERGREVRLGLPTPDQATFGRACLALYASQGQKPPSCDDEAFTRLGFGTVTNRSTTAALIDLLLAEQVDAVIIGGPLCPEGTERLRGAEGVAALSWPEAVPGFETEEGVFGCLQKQKGRSVVGWTYLAAAPGLRLSKGEFHSTLSGLRDLGPRFPAFTFADFRSLDTWPGYKQGEAAYQMSYSAITSRYERLATAHPEDLESDTIRDFVYLHLPEVQFFSIVLGIVGTAITIGGKVKGGK
jgi:hypothetical protein